VLDQFGVRQGEAPGPHRTGHRPALRRPWPGHQADVADRRHSYHRAGGEYEAISREVKAKYGFMTTITKALGAIGGMLRRKQIPTGTAAS